MLPGFGNQGEKIIEAGIGVLFRRTDPDQDIQVFQEIQYQFPILGNEAIEIRQVAKHNVTDSLGVMGQRLPGKLALSHCRRDGLAGMVVNEHPVGMRAAMVGRGNR